MDFTIRRMMHRLTISLMFLLFSVCVSAQEQATLSIEVTDSESKPIDESLVYVQEVNAYLLTDKLGQASIEVDVPNTYHLLVKNLSSASQEYQVYVTRDTMVLVVLEHAISEIEEVVIEADIFGVRQLRPIEEDGLYEGKKSDVINIDKLVSNKATNNARQTFGKVPSLNIWESDEAGLQLDIGGRGLSPKRTSNFNTRQNGYDISADALGYPESYYTPPLQAVQQVEVVRGAGALQYGTQFGGLLNFKMKRGNKDKALNVDLQQSYGANRFVNSYNAIHGQIKKMNYYSYGQFKRGDGWRPNAEFEQLGGGLFLQYRLSPRLEIGLDITHMSYLSQQAGGLVDEVFERDPYFSNRDRNWFRVRWNLAALKVRYALNEKTTLFSRTFGLIARRTSLGLLETPDIEDPLGHRDLIDGKFRNIGNETRVVHNYAGRDGLVNSFVMGARLFRGQTNFSQQFGSQGDDANFERVDTSFLDRRRSDFNFPNLNLAFFSEHIFRLSKELSLVPGFRYEYIDTRSEGYFTKSVRINSFGDFIERKNESSSEKDRHVLLFGLGASYKWSDMYELYANATSNYRAINFSDIQIQTNTQLVDSLIKDESGYSFDVGVRRRTNDPFFIEGGVFFIIYDDRIGEVIDDGIRVRTNIGAAHIVGAEVYAELDVYRLLKKSSRHKMSVFVNGSINHGVYKQINERALVGVSSGNRLEDLPNYSIKAGATYGVGQFKASFQGNFIGQQYSDAANTTRPFVGVYGEIPSYEVFDFSSTYRFSEHVRIGFNVNNVFNKSYFTRRAAAYPGPGIIPATPRIWNVSVGVTF